jgi:membrane-associated protease RseP (regulator of RpoE activity)
MNTIRTTVALCIVTFLLGGIAVAGDEDHPGYMIGLKGAKASHADRKHHKIKGPHGVSVIDVLDDGPADMAGIEPGDLVIRIGKQPLDTMSQLRDAVDSSMGRALQLTFKRAGRKRTVDVSPTKRSDSDLLRREAEKVVEKATGGNGLSGLLKDFSPLDLLNLDNLDIEVRRGGKSASPSNGSEPPWDDSRDAITIYGRINVGQLFGGFFSDREASESDRLERQLRELQQEVERLKKQLDNLSGTTSPSDA